MTRVEIIWPESNSKRKRRHIGVTRASLARGKWIDPANNQYEEQPRWLSGESGRVSIDADKRATCLWVNKHNRDIIDVLPGR